MRLSPDRKRRSLSCGVFNAGPLESIQPFTKGEMLDDLAVSKYETIGKSSINPFGRVLQADPGMEIYDNLVSVHQELLGLTRPFGPGVASFRDVFLDLSDTTVGSGCREALWLDPHNLRIEVPGYRVNVIAIDGVEELFEGFSFDAHMSVEPRQVSDVECRPNAPNERRASDIIAQTFGRIGSSQSVLPVELLGLARPARLSRAVPNLHPPLCTR